MKVYALFQKRRFTLPGNPIACGGEAAIYRVKEDWDLVAKMFTKKRRTQWREEKLRLMIQQRQNLQSILPHLAWPVDVLYVNRQFVGYLMPRVEGAFEIARIMIRKSRLKVAPTMNFCYLAAIAQNIAFVLSKLHQNSILVGDINERNILVRGDATIVWIDTDSFQIYDAQRGRFYPCPVGTPEYLPPEHQKKNLHRVQRTWSSDAFSLAVLFFKLFMMGFHPFSGSLPARWRSTSLDHITFIVHGWCPYTRAGRRMGIRPPRGAPLFSVLSPEIRDLFERAFGVGLQKPGQRPRPEEWLASLHAFRTSLIPCSVNPNHWYGSHLSTCPWCDYARRNQVDFFPRPSHMPHAFSLRTQNVPKGPRGMQTYTQRPGHVFQRIFQNFSIVHYFQIFSRWFDKYFFPAIVIITIIFIIASIGFSFLQHRSRSSMHSTGEKYKEQKNFTDLDEILSQSGLQNVVQKPKQEYGPFTSSKPSKNVVQPGPEKPSLVHNYGMDEKSSQHSRPLSEPQNIDFRDAQPLSPSLPVPLRLVDKTCLKRHLMNHVMFRKFKKMVIHEPTRVFFSARIETNSAGKPVNVEFLSFRPLNLEHKELLQTYLEESLKKCSFTPPGIKGMYSRSLLFR